MYYSDTFKSDKKTTLAINEFRKRGPAEIRTVKKFVILVRLTCLSAVTDTRETVYHNNRTRF